MLWLLIPAILFAGLAAMVAAGGRQVMHPRRPARPAAPPGGRPVTFPASDGVTIRGWHFPVEGAKGTVVYGPGRGQGLNEFDFRYIPLLQPQRLLAPALRCPGPGRQRRRVVPRRPGVA